MADEAAVVEAPHGLHTFEGAGVLLARGRAELGRGRRLVVDLTRAGAIGATGAAALLSLRRRAEQVGAGFELRGVTPEQLRELSALPAPQLHGATVEQSRSLFVYLGTIAGEVAEQFLDFLSLMADTLYWCGRRLTGRGPWRRGQFVREALAIGNEGLPIVAVVAMLVGLVTAFQAADQLRQFGAHIFIANLVGLGVLREMGPLITAILVAGRSGSAMAAELGTMAVEEEIDGLRVMAIDPIPYLVVPKALATVVAVPSLTMLANVFGVLGGFVIAVLYLDLAPDAFIAQFLRAIDPWDVLTGIVKSVLFAIVIVSVACHFGLRLRGGAEDVGRAATNAVVASLFLIILVDGVYVTVETIVR
jgi:phospholipid/cholesterol/gamma-HCH transport system permease protein